MSGSSRTSMDGLAPTGHDTHLYDPTMQDNQIVALYETLVEAKAAKQALLAAGVDEAAIQVMDGSGHADSSDTMPVSPPAMTEGTTDGGFWSTLGNLFAPHEDTHAYGHALERGHAMLVVMPAKTANRGSIIEVLEHSGPINFDARLEEWRQTGYDYSSSNALHTETATGAATGSGTAMGDVKNASADAWGEFTRKRPRVGTRDAQTGSGSVRSYSVSRPDTDRDGGNLDTASTMGATTSGMNAPRKP